MPEAPIKKIKLIYCEAINFKKPPLQKEVAIFAKGEDRRRI
jgi:hypothetical protein